MKKNFLILSLVLVSILMIASALIVTFAIPSSLTAPGAMVDEQWWQIIVSEDEAMTAASIHDIDVMDVSRPVDLGWFHANGWTVISNQRIGYTFTMENNRVWPFGTPTGSPEDPLYENAMYFRKGIHRIINKDAIVGIYAPLRSKAEAWLPPGQAYWISPDIDLPEFDPWAAAAMFDAGGFVEGTFENPYFDPGWHPASAEYLRIDPKTGEPVSFEYYGLLEPCGSSGLITMIGSWMRKIGLTVDLVAGTWLGMVSRLVNTNLYDYQFMTGLGIVWDSTAPDILFDFTYSENVPLWNFAHVNLTEADYWDLELMGTLNKTRAREAAFEIQNVLATCEPYMPMLLWERFTAYTDPWPEETEPFMNAGFIGIVNMEGFGGLDTNNIWGNQFGRAGRFDPERPEVEINKYRLPDYLDTLNPLTANTELDWQPLSLVTDVGCRRPLYRLNPYSHEWMWWAARDEPITELWIGPGDADVVGGNGVYDASVTYDGWVELQTYNGIPVEDVTENDLVGDDTLGMKTTWTLRDNMYWHDSDPGADMEFGTGDDGTVYPVTAEDYKFCVDLLMRQNNTKYHGIWQFINKVKVKTSQSFTVYEERRYIWSLEDHGIGFLTSKHVWEPWIAGADFTLWTEDDNHHEQWFGWENEYMECPVHPGESLTELIGFGPFHYHYGGWVPGQYVHVEATPVYYLALWDDEPLVGDVTLDGAVFINDLYIIVDNFGKHPNVDPDYDPMADTAYPAQTIDLDDVFAAAAQLGKEWYP